MLLFTLFFSRYKITSVCYDLAVSLGFVSSTILGALFRKKIRSQQEVVRDLAKSLLEHFAVT